MVSVPWRTSPLSHIPPSERDALAHSAQPCRRPAHIVFVVNVDWFFLSHRLPLARAARDRGARVTVVAADTGHADRIRAESLNYHPLPLARQGRGLRGEAGTFLALLTLYRRLKPDLLHHVTVKPILYGSLAARLTARNTPIINAISGFGYSFSPSGVSRFLRTTVRLLYRAALAGSNRLTIFQNSSDLEDFVHAGFVSRENVRLIRGAGVDTSFFTPAPCPDGPPIVLLASRMLWSKGVGDLVAAAPEIRRQHPCARLVVLGHSDDNPDAIPISTLERWHQAGTIEWWGHVADPRAAIQQSSLVVLPTYYPEGIPKVLLEAASCARAIVATDIPGCREIVHHTVNGLLVAPRDPEQLAAAVASLLSSPDSLRRYGAKSRRIAQEEFSEERVVQATLDAYATLLPTFPYTAPYDTAPGAPE